MAMLTIMQPHIIRINTIIVSIATAQSQGRVQQTSHVKLSQTGKTLEMDMHLWKESLVSEVKLTFPTTLEQRMFIKLTSGGTERLESTV